MRSRESVVRVHPSPLLLLLGEVAQLVEQRKAKNEI